MREARIPATITLDGDVCVVDIRHQAAIRAKVLGVEIVDGARVVYLDRLVHPPWAEALGNWRVHGAISSILTESMP